MSIQLTIQTKQQSPTPERTLDQSAIFRISTIHSTDLHLRYLILNTLILDEMTSPVAAPATLGVLLLWGYIDREILAEGTAKYKPVPIPETPKFKASDVSVVTCTLNPEPSFIFVLEGWLRNNPREVIVATRAPFVKAILEKIGAANFDSSNVRVVATPDDLPGVRGQLVHGLRQTSGSLVAAVDAHIQWVSDKYIIAMAAAFEDEKIGMTGGDIKVRVVKKTEDITPWEVASAKVCAGRRPAAEGMYALTKFRWVLPGGTIMGRASIWRDPEFQHGFMNDIWHKPFGGTVRLDSGDDTFISRWTAAHGYVCASQTMPETLITRVPKSNGLPWFKQMVRWERSTLQSFSRALWETPQVWENPYILRKTLERLSLFPLAAINVWAWIVCLWHYPLPTLILLGYYILRIVRGLQAFYRECPNLPRKYWWAALLADYTCMLLQPYVWWNLGVEEWHMGEIVKK